MDTKELLTVIGWPVTVLTGIASGFIISRLTRKRQILTWAVINEIELIPRALSDTLGVPVSLQVGDARPSSLSALTIRIGNSGNETIRDITLAVALNPGATILNVRFSADLEAYCEPVRLGPLLRRASNGCARVTTAESAQSGVHFFFFDKRAPVCLRYSLAHSGTRTRLLGQHAQRRTFTSPSGSIPA